MTDIVNIPEDVWTPQYMGEFKDVSPQEAWKNTEKLIKRAFQEQARELAYEKYLTELEEARQTDYAADIAARAQRYEEMLAKQAEERRIKELEEKLEAERRIKESEQQTDWDLF